MISTKFRPSALAAALAAAATFAVATGPITPSAHAAKSQASVTGHAALCSFLRDLSISDSVAAGDAYAAGDRAKGDKYTAFAAADKTAAEGEGCAWASRVVTGAGSVSPGPIGPSAPTP
jgi:hypothetical protein